MVRLGFEESAAAAWVAFDACCRLQDWTRLRVSDVSDANGEVGLEFGVRARGERCKTGHSQGVVLRTEAARAFVRSRSQSRPLSALVFNVQADQFRKQWYAAVKELGLAKDEVGPPHVLRHAGAAHLSLREKVDFKDIKARGRWAVDSSVRRYCKPHILVKMMAALPAAVEQLGQAFLQDPSSALRAARQVKAKPQ